MASFNWSMTALGYPAHRRSAARVVGLSHMSTHEVLSVADHLGLSSGWLHAEGNQPQLERVRASRPVRVDLAGLLADRRVVMTDGLASGSLTYAAVGDAGDPPNDRSLTVWADEVARPWIEVVDNELAYWGGLNDSQIDTLLAWYLAQRPLPGEWRTTRFAPGVAARLRQVLFAHGWQRNLGLVKDGRKPSVDLWAGVHSACMLDHPGSLPPSLVGQGVRLILVQGEWTLSDIGSRCPLADDSAKMER
jgi:hypothetical protein